MSICAANRDGLIPNLDRTRKIFMCRVMQSDAEFSHFDVVDKGVDDLILIIGIYSWVVPSISTWPRK